MLLFKVANLCCSERTNTISNLSELYGYEPLICCHFDELDDNNYSTETQSIIDLSQFLTEANMYNDA